MRYRSGMGYDSHRFGAPRPLVLGGVAIPYTSGLIAHSDGDAVAHALIDALLGAAALGDIGRLFPDTDPRFKDANSLKLLAEVRERLEQAGFHAVNVDVTVVLEAPRLAPHLDQIRTNLAATLDLPLSAVSVKAKTNEGLDAVGEGRGLQVFAAATVGSD